MTADVFRGKWSGRWREERKGSAKALPALGEGPRLRYLHTPQEATTAKAASSLSSCPSCVNRGNQPRFSVLPRSLQSQSLPPHPCSSPAAVPSPSSQEPRSPPLPFLPTKLPPPPPPPGRGSPSPAPEPQPLHKTISAPVPAVTSLPSLQILGRLQQPLDVDQLHLLHAPGSRPGRGGLQRLPQNPPSSLLDG